MAKRHWTIRLADRLTETFGSIWFLLCNLIFFTGWIAVNNGLIPAVTPFDPYPFILLITLVSLEAIMLSIIVLMSQNRASAINTLRDEMELQVEMIAEREVTKALKLLTDLHRHHGVKSEDDPDLAAMLKDTDLSYIERKLEEQLASEPTPFHKAVTEPLAKLTKQVGETFKNERH